MGLLKKIFGELKETNEKIEFNWQFLNSVEQIATIIESSKTNPQIIFKYSTRCGISSMVLNQFEKDNKELNDDFDFHFLNLIKYRNVSNLIASQFNIRHESPQLLVISNGRVVKHSSHGSINNIDLNGVLY